MIRITTLLLLVMFWSTAAFALVYQCRNKDGTLFLTNNRDKFPPGCVQVGEPMGEERTLSPPAAPPPRGRGSEPEMRDRPRPVAPPRAQAPPAAQEETEPETPSAEAGAPAGEAEIAPAEAPESGVGAVSEPSPQNERADGLPADAPNAPGQPAGPTVETPVEAR
jgi:hypothetical protein